MAFVYSEDSAFTGRSTPTSFCWNFLILCLNDVDPLDICMKKCLYCEKIILDKMTAMRTWAIFLVFLQVTAFTGRSTPTTVFDGII